MDVSEFLKPISEDRPCGENLRYENVYDKLKEFRREDDDRLSQGIWQTEPKKANWPEVVKLATKLLTTQTKDLQIAIWLTEAWIAEKEFEGLNDGLQLIKGLTETFWDDLYPEIDVENDDYTFRMAPFIFLSDKISDRIALIPLTDKENSEVYSLASWMDARRNLQIKNYKGLSLQTIGKQVAITPIEMIQSTKEQIDKSLSLVNDIKTFLDEKCPKDSPSFNILRERLQDIQRITAKNLELKHKQEASMPRRPKQTISEEDEQREMEASVSNASGNSPKQEGPTLEQAYKVLSEVAIFLEQKQPQSPASTLIKIAQKIGEKSFQELMELNMTSGVSVLNTISELNKVLRPPKEEVEDKEILEKFK